MSNPLSEYIDTLSKEQYDGASCIDHPVMLIACAGSGKTRTLVGRLAKLLLPRDEGGQGADPGSVMMVTFTNKAAREMRERIQPILEHVRERDPSVTGEPWIGTFHGLSLRILRLESARAGLGQNFSIFDESDAADLAREVAKNMMLETFDVDAFFRDLEQAKARLFTPVLLTQKSLEIEEILDLSAEMSADQALWQDILSRFETANFPLLYAQYQLALDEQNAVDFSDLMNRVTRLFQENEVVANTWRSNFRHFMVDEVQDINLAQVAWISEMTADGQEMHSHDYPSEPIIDEDGGIHEINHYRLRRTPRPSIAFVGDDDQSIYGFRGSDPAVLKKLMRRFGDIEVKFLRESYRCQPSILGAANALVKNNAGRFEKTIIPADQHRPAKPVRIVRFETPRKEVEAIARDAKKHIAEGGDPSQFAVLLRTREMVKAVARDLREAGLPVTEGKASDIRKTMEVRDAMAYAGFIDNPQAETYLRRIINKPARQLGPTSMSRVNGNARLKGIPFLTELGQITSDKIDLPEGAEPYKPAFVKNLKSFSQLLRTMKMQAHQAANAAEAIFGILETSGYLPSLKRDALSASGLIHLEDEMAGLEPRDFLTKMIAALPNKKADIADDIGGEELADRASRISEASRRLGNLSIFLDQAREHQTLEAFLQEATLEMNQSEIAAGIQVMTVHGSKGLEFEKVRLPFWLEGIFPHSNALSEGPDAIDEERRLAYVALTRAKEDIQVSVSFKIANTPFIRLRSSKLSPFIDEIQAAPNSDYKLYGLRPAFRSPARFRNRPSQEASGRPDLMPENPETAARREVDDLSATRNVFRQVLGRPRLAEPEQKQDDGFEVPF